MAKSATGHIEFVYHRETSYIFKLIPLQPPDPAHWPQNSYFEIKDTFPTFDSITRLLGLALEHAVPLETRATTDFDPAAVAEVAYVIIPARNLNQQTMQPPSNVIRFRGSV